MAPSDQKCLSHPTEADNQREGKRRLFRYALCDAPRLPDVLLTRVSECAAKDGTRIKYSCAGKVDRNEP